ncbi:MAG TPA: DNA translocase FtsK, partial [Bacilli bacterium]|nr:DNA translocase FtsK [Bacilli bacterium]
YFILFAFIILSHLQLFKTLSAQSGFVDQSVIRNTWQLFLLDVTNQSTSTDLGGGMVGAVGFAVTHFLFDEAGTILVAIVSFILAFIFITGRSVSEVVAKVLGSTIQLSRRIFQKGKENLSESFQSMKEKVTKEISEQQPQTKQVEEKQTKVKSIEQEEEKVPIIHDFSTHAKNQAEVSESTEIEQMTEVDKIDDDTESLMMAELANEAYQLPSIDMLKLPNNNQVNIRKQRSKAEEDAKKLKQTLESFGVKAVVSEVHLGPAVTKYEIHPSVGVKVSRIVSLADDLALALAAKDIRIEAPIPGKPAIGIEVPNQEVSLVTLREVIDSAKGSSYQSPLAVGLGRDISGEPVMAELNKMPHLLVAGATGSGKSVCINGMITSILMRAKPHEVKLMMIDPKMVELSVYNGIPHLLAPVVTDPKKASQALKKVVSEMERRYDLFSHTGVRNIEGYNDFVTRENEASGGKQPFLPYIVVIVDELADLMMVASGDVEDSITRLAQMARAAGIHMIIATQRPSVDVITGVIKANIPSRIAFGVSSATDSRTILDSGGAEKLLGRGDMLYLPMGATKPTRVQGAFLSDDEVESVVQFVISQQKAQYQEEMIPKDEQSSSLQEVEDEIYEPAVELVVEMGTASVSMLQRRFRIGYTRAARLIDEMEARGVVGPYEGSKPREVLISKREQEGASSQ